MRIKTIEGMGGDVYRITYGEDSLFLYDNNTITVENLSETAFGAKVIITNNVNGEVRVMSYRSELPKITFLLDSSLKSLLVTGEEYSEEISIRVETYAWLLDVADGVWGWDCRLLKGKSFTSESHGAERVIYAYSSDDIERIELFFPASGTIEIEGNYFDVEKGWNWVDLSEVISTTGTYTIHYENGEITPRVTITSVEPDTRSAQVILSMIDSSGDIGGGDIKGGVWEDTIFLPDNYDITIHYEEVCTDMDIVRLDYINADGCWRHLCGRITAETLDAEWTGYDREYDIYNSVPFSYITSITQSLKVVFPELDRLSYWNHILFSPNLLFTNYKDEKVPCVVKSKSVTKTDDRYQDVELDITLIR